MLHLEAFVSGSERCLNLIRFPSVASVCPCHIAQITGQELGKWWARMLTVDFSKLWETRLGDPSRPLKLHGHQILTLEVPKGWVSPALKEPTVWLERPAMKQVQSKMRQY